MQYIHTSVMVCISKISCKYLCYVIPMRQTVFQHVMIVNVTVSSHVRDPRVMDILSVMLGVDLKEEVSDL